MAGKKPPLEGQSAVAATTDPRFSGGLSSSSGGELKLYTSTGKEGISTVCFRNLLDLHPGRQHVVPADHSVRPPDVPPPTGSASS